MRNPRFIKCSGNDLVVRSRKGTSIKSELLQFVLHVALWTMIFPAYAADFLLTPQAKAMVRIEDNILGSSSNPESAWGFDLSSKMNLKALTPSTTTEVIPRVNLRRFVVGDNFDADEYGVDFNNSFVGNQFAAALDFSYGRDSTLTTENTDSGRVSAATNRDSVTLRPTIDYVIDERLVAQAGFLYNSVNYLDAATTGFVNYDYKQESLGVTYKWRDNADFIVSGYRSDFESGSGDSRTVSYSAQVGLRWRWSETLETTGAVGWIDSNIDFLERRLIFVGAVNPTPVLVDVPVNTSSSGPIANASVQKRFEFTTVEFDYARQVSPTGRGSQSSADHIELMILRRLTEDLRVQFNGIYDMQSSEIAGFGPAFPGGVLDRDYLSFTAMARYRVVRDWTVSAVYRFANRKSTNFGSANNSDSNALFFAVEFNGEQLNF